MNEYLGANLKESRERGEAINTAPEHIKDIWARNNARNADLYSQAKTLGKLDGTDVIPADKTYDNLEDQLIEKLDSERTFDVKNKLNDGDDSAD